MPKNRRASLAQRLALAPYSVWAVIFVAVPLVFVAYYAFTDESFRFTTENLTKFFHRREHDHRRQRRHA